GSIDTGGAPFDNLGRVIADPDAAGANPNPSFTTITLSGAGWTNHGTVGARNGGTVTLSSPAGSGWGGPGGTISTDANAASTVNLGGTVRTAGLGTFSRAGGAVNLTGVLDNSNQVLTLDASRGKWNLKG